MGMVIPDEWERYKPPPTIIEWSKKSHGIACSGKARLDLREALRLKILPEYIIVAGAINTTASNERSHLLQSRLTSYCSNRYAIHRSAKDYHVYQLTALFTVRAQRMLGRSFSSNNRNSFFVSLCWAVPYRSIKKESSVAMIDDPIAFDLADKAKRSDSAIWVP
jgi:hypothetical protein